VVALDFLGAVLGDGGEAWVDVLHHAVAVDQQEGAGALLHGPLEQVQGAGGGAPVVVGDDLGELVGELTGKGDFIGLPGARLAGLLQAQHADYLAIDADAGVEHGVVVGIQALGQVTGARVVVGVVRVDGTAGVQGVQVVGEAAGIDRFGQAVRLLVAQPGADRLQTLLFQVPDAGAVNLVDLAGAAGDQLGGFEQRVFGAVALAGQAQDEVLLGTHAFQVLKLLLLGTLVDLQGQLQAVVARFQVVGVEVTVVVIEHREEAAQQLAVVLLECLAGFQQAQRAGLGVQGVAHTVVAAVAQLQLDFIVQPVTGLGLHEAGIGRIDQRTQLGSGQAELAFASRIEVKHRPVGFVQPFETQHAEPRGHGELRHDLGRHTAGGIGLAFHRRLA